MGKSTSVENGLRLAKSCEYAPIIAHVFLGLAVPETLGIDGRSADVKDRKVPPPLSANYDFKRLTRFNPGDLYFNPAFSITASVSSAVSSCFPDLWLFSASPRLRGELLGFGSPDFPDHRILTRSFLRRPPFFTFCCKQTLCSNQPERGPCVTLGWPLGHAWVTQASPKPRPNPKSGRGSQALRITV